MKNSNLIAENLKNKRIENGLSQDDLSIKSGIERSQISRIEKGCVNPRVDTIEAIARALRIPPSELFDDEKSLTIRPFVKWAGGKTQLLSNIIALMPKTFNNYYEPFVGGGAVLFKIQPKKAYINDLNSDLLCVYRCFQEENNFQALKEYLTFHEENHSEEYFIKIRTMDREKSYNHYDVVLKASRLIYLNKACFNGIYRVNSKGFFNVPSAKKSKVICFDRKNFENLRKYFKEHDVCITNFDFEKAVMKARKGDFVYFDPPYDDWDNKSTFKDYTSCSFKKKDQIRLFKCFEELSNRGVYVMLSNNNTSMIRELYKNYKIHVVPARRMINRDANGRGKVEEVIITNY